MNRETYTYAYIKTLYNQKNDYLDTFLHFCLLAFPQEEFVDRNFIKKKLKEIFELDIPLYVLDTIMSRGIEIGHIAQSKKQNNYKLTEEGSSYLVKIERPEDVERRINELIEDIKIFFTNNSRNLTSLEINSLLISFLNKNKDPIIGFLNPSNSTSKILIGKLTEDETLLVKYMELAEKQKPAEYQTLQDMIFGSIISTILYVDNPSDLINYTKKKFESISVFFDTNYVFSLLDMQSPKDRYVAATELFQLMKEFGFRFKIFDFTIDETVGVINGYIEQSYRYPKSINIRSIYSSLKKKGWTKVEARHFISNVEIILKELGIETERTDIDLKSYTPENEKYVDILMKYKNFQEDFNRNHDIAAIEIIAKIRKNKFRRIEEINSFFLSCDTRLSKLNFYEMGHKNDGTICEVILDRFITTLLWLKNPSLKLSLKSIITTYSRDIAVKRRIWERFYDNLNELKKSGKINDDDISMLFYHNYIEDILNKFEESAVDQINESFVIDSIEKAAKFKEKLTKNEIQKEITEIEKKKEKEFFEKLEVGKREIEKEKNEEWKVKVHNLKSQYRKKSDSKAKRIINTLRCILGLVLICPMIYLIIKMSWSDLLLFTGILDGIIIIFGLVFGPAIKYWKKLEKIISEKSYLKILKNAELDKL